MIILTPEELRVLGALVEKQISTPEYYPLSLNALVNACNQKNHRDPVVSYGETTVLRALDRLREMQLAIAFSGADARVPKYSHTLTRVFEDFTAPDIAVMAVLMLRGPQTPGELRSRTPHLHNFESLAAVDETLQRLTARAEPLVRKLPRAPGTKEARYTHLLGGEAAVESAEAAEPVTPVVAPQPTDQDRLSKLEDEVERLRQQLGELQTQLMELKKQLE